MARKSEISPSPSKPLHVPSFWYHPDEAPEGQLFRKSADIAKLDDTWVDTPAKFPKAEARQ